jgi:hypothetical protein
VCMTASARVWDMDRATWLAIPRTKHCSRGEGLDLEDASIARPLASFRLRNGKWSRLALTGEGT